MVAVHPLPRLGLILLATDLTTERDVARLIGPDEAAVHATRVAYANPTTPENLRRMAPRLGEAAALLVPGVPLGAIVFACTSASVVIGEAAVREAVGAGRPQVPVVTPTNASATALRALGVRRIAIFTPYLPETMAPVVAHFETLGFEVVRSHCLGLDDDRVMAEVAADTILGGALAADADEAEAVFVSCTALPALAVVGRIEAALGKPVVTSNQASIWAARRLAGLAGPLPGFGRLLAEVPEASAA
jgi:maleate isomerase